MIAHNPSAAALCRAVGFLVDNPSPQFCPQWLCDIPSPVRESLGNWLRSETAAFMHDEDRGSESGYPSWHFAVAVAVALEFPVDEEGNA